MGTIVLFLAIEKSYVTLKCNSHFRIGNGKIELVMRMVTRTTKSNEPAFFNGAKNSLLSPTNFKKCHLSQLSVPSFIFFLSRDSARLDSAQLKLNNEMSVNLNFQ